MKSPARIHFFLALAAVACGASLRAEPDAQATAGRALVKKYADAVVSVEMVSTTKISMGDRPASPQERKIEINGTVISASGLTVTALSGIDPRSMLENMRRNGQRIDIGETEYKEVKLRLADGSEVPARVVLKDQDLDLAFIVPAEGEGAAKREFPFVSLDQPAEGAQLGTYFVVSRAGKSLQRVPVARVVTVEGIAEKPRRIYLVSNPAIGSPVLDAAGHTLGLCMIQIASSGTTIVVLPAADIQDIAKQAAEAALKPVEAPKPAEDVKPAEEAKPADAAAPKTGG